MRLLAALGGGACSAGSARSVLSLAPPALGPLFPPHSPTPTPGLTATATVLLLCERSAFLAAHQALAFAVQEEAAAAVAGGGGTADPLPPPLWHAVTGFCRAALVGVLQAGGEGMQEVLKGVEDVRLAAQAVAAPRAFDPAMLQRTTFLPCSTANGYTETLVLGGAAVGLYLACNHVRRVGGEGEVVGPASLEGLAAALAALGSALDLPLDPFLTFSQGYAPGSGAPDAFPSAYAASRVAERVLQGLLLSSAGGADV